MTDHYDTLETRDPAERERALMAALPAQVEHARTHAPFYAALLKDVDPRAVRSREALAKLPLTRKHAVMKLQQENPPFGGLLAEAASSLAHIYASPGPIYEWDTHRPDHWRGARSLYAHGFRRGDIVQNTYSYHLTPAGAFFESSARAVGCVVIPAGVGNTELQVRTIHDVKPTGYVGTPSFLRILLEKAKEMGLSTVSLKKASVGAEALPPVLRREFEDQGIHTRQSYGTADLGMIAYESEAMEGMIIDEGLIVEIVRPGTGDPLPDGEVGEVVVTTFNPAYPLLRFATGDMSAIMPGVSPCGRTAPRIKGWMGRADQRTKVKGMFVDPEQVVEVLKRHPQLVKVRLEVEWLDKADSMTLHAETAAGSPELARAVEASIQAVCKVRGGVKFVTPGSLPNDGKVIADVRKYE